MNKLYFLFVLTVIFSCHPDKVEYETSAKKSLETGQFEQTLTITSEALDHYPNDPQFFIYRGVANFELENTTEAIDDFTSSIKYDSGNYKSYYNLGNCYFQLDEYDKAIEYYQHALRLNPKEVEIYINLGNSYFELESYEKSLRQFEFALKLDSTSYLANLNASRNLIMEEKFDEAKPFLQKCISVNPDRGDAYFFLAYVYYLLEQEQEEYCLLLSKSKSLGFKSTNDTLDTLCN